MKKILITLLIIAMLAQPVPAKDITVIFNFPEGTSADVQETITLEEDANAFHAFVTVADEQNLELGMTYYESFDSWLIDSVNDVENSTGQYWHFWVNNESSMVGIGASVPENNDIIELGFENDPKGVESSVAETGLQWLLDNEQEDGEIGEHKTWGNAFSLIALNLFPENEGIKEAASDYLLSIQGEDAGFGYPGFDSDAVHTAVSILGLIANNLSLEDFAKDSVTSIQFLLSKQENDGGFSGWASSDVDTTSWAILAFKAAGQQTPSKNDNTPADYLFSAQNEDGGFGYQGGQASSEEYTSEALIALSAANQEASSEAGDALEWLLDQQGTDGCFSNSFTTALASIALSSFEEDTAEAIDCLETLQLEDNGFGRDGETSNAPDTALAVIALTGSTIPTMELTPVGNPDYVPLGGIAKFTVLITNTGPITAENVQISLSGIPESWINELTSERNFSSIEPNQTVEAEIYVEMMETGEIEVFASVSGEGLSGNAYSNSISFEIATTSLNVSLSME